jgi:menaquinone-specific isochorismate synthase
MGDVVRAQPLAGTAPRGGDPASDARLAASLLASTKDREEHRITIDSLHDVLLPFCSYLDEEPEPSIVAVANVQHLATTVEGRLSNPPASALELASVLHPTPAVGGDPKDAALACIREEEGLDRGRYAGPVGWSDAAGNGRWAVGIRSAEVEGPIARVFAGNGIVADSDPTTELAETRAKLQAMLGAIVRP